MGGSLANLLDYSGNQGKTPRDIHMCMYIYIYIFKQYLHENWPDFLLGLAAIKMSAAI